MKTALRHRSFRWVAAIYSAGALLEWFGSVALMVLVYRATESTTVAAALLLCKQVIPGALVPLVGTRLERIAVGRGLAPAAAVQASALAAIGFVGYGALVFPLAVVAGTAGAIVRALLRTGVARSLHGPDLRAGNALLNTAMGIAALAGPAVAALAVGVAGPAPALLFTAALLGLVVIAATSMPSLPAVDAVDASDAEAADDAESPAASRRSDAVPLSWLLLLVGVVCCVFSMDDPTLLAYSEDSLLAGVGGYGAIFTAWGVGVTLGSLLFSRLLAWPMLRVYALATVLAGGAYLGLSVSPTITVACAFAVVGGVGNGMDWVAIVTAIQEATPVGQEARTAMRLEAITTAGPGLGILVGGVLADLTDPRLTLLIPGLTALAVLAIGTAAIRLRSARSAARPSVAAPTFSSSIHGGSA